MILRYDGTTKIAEVAGVGEGSITSAKLADNSVTTTKVVDGSITTAKLANSAATSDKIDWTTMPEKVGQDWNYCLKYPNGIMVAVQRKWFSVEVKSTWGNVYNAGGGFDLDDFAQAFVDVPVSVSWLLPTVGAAWLTSGGSKFLSTTSPGGVNIMRPQPRDVVQGNICTIAIGRWK